MAWESRTQSLDVFSLPLLLSDSAPLAIGGGGVSSSVKWEN